jgi:transposase-like protein
MDDVRRLPVGGDKEIEVTLDDLAREGARRMIAAALKAEADEYVERFAEEVDEDGRRLVVRNGRARERKLTIGSGTVAIQAPRVNDKRVDEETGERERFSSTILPAYARRSPKVNDVLPVLYLRGLSTGDFRPALEQLLGEDAAGLSPSTISRLCKDWEAEHERFRERSLRFHRYAYLFVDGVHVSVRLGEDDRLCLLVVIGVREDGTKELLAVEDGYRESTESWASVMRDLKACGLNEPKLVIGERRARDVGGAARRVPRRAPPGVLGAQDRQRPRRAAQAAAGQGQGPAARDHGSAVSRRRAPGAQAVRRGVRREIRRFCCFRG